MDYIEKFTGSLRFAGRSENTIRAYESDLRQIENTLNKTLVEARPLELLDYFTNLKLETSTINRRVDSIHKYYSFLMDMEVISKDPSKGIEAPKEEQKEVRYTPSKTEVAAMIKATKNAKTKAIVTVLSETGLRFSEFANIKLEDLSDVIVVKGKGNKIRRVPLSPKAKEAIEEYLKVRKDGDDTLFTSDRGTKLDNSSVYRSLRTLAKKAGIEKWNEVEPHCLRRFAVSEAHKKGLPIGIIEKMFGHSFGVEKKNYLSVTDEELLSMVQ